jgi:hypothetical protein
MDLAELNKEVDKYLKLKGIVRSRLVKAHIYASILATEYYVCAGLGFTKYLN